LPFKILDFGCGTGRGLPYLQKHFPDAEIWGFDPSGESLRFAHIACPDAKLESDWSRLQPASFDLIVAANVFHHIPVNGQKRALQDCRDMLTTSGNMFLFEHNPSNPATRWVFERCPLDVDAEMISLSSALHLAKSAHMRVAMHQYTLFFPRPLAFLRRFEALLGRVPLGAQYYVQMGK
jgi:trans-aconitate methyltransferase